MEVICLNCEIKFDKKSYEIKRSPNHFCSRNCNNEFQKTSVEVECKKCSKKFIKKFKEYKKSPNHFCSKSCAVSYNNTQKKYGTRRSKLESYLEEQIRENYPQLDLVCNQKTVIESELDFYFPQLKFAIELNGITHYEPIYGQDKFEKIQNNDKRKVIACYEKGIELAVIDSSSCKNLSANHKEKFKKLTFGLIDQVKNRI